MTTDGGAPFTLYGMGSPNVRKVAIMLEELGLDYALRHVGVFAAEQFDPAFLALNPLGKVPVLVDHAAGETLYESGAILFYLAERHGALLPPAGHDRYEVVQWLIVQMANIGPMFGQLNHFDLMTPGDAKTYGQARYHGIAARLYRLLDDRLAGCEWLAGDAYSIADIATFPWAHYLAQHRLAAADHPALTRWCARIAARPAVARAAARFAELSAPMVESIARATDAQVDRFFSMPAGIGALDLGAFGR